jgi:hypothetical protein
LVTRVTNFPAVSMVTLLGQFPCLPTLPMFLGF